jgi:hypothetical protein
LRRLRQRTVGPVVEEVALATVSKPRDPRGKEFEEVLRSLVDKGFPGVGLSVGSA